jgi:hypothetical protein
MQLSLSCSQSWLVVLLVAVPPLRAQTPRSPSVPRVLVRIDGMNSDFSRFGPIAASASGLLAVAQPQDGTVLLFSADGRQLATVGRKGSGPGEFRGINQLGWSGDTLWVVDYSNNRLTLISPTGRIAREIALPLRVDGSRVAGTVQGLRWSPRVQALYRDGTLLFSARRSAPGGAANGPREIEEWFIRGKIDGELQAAVFRSPPNTCSRRAEGATVVQVVLHFCPQPMTAIATDGSRLVVATMTTTPDGAGSYSVVVRSGEGRDIFAQSAATRLEPVPGPLRDSLVEGYRTDNPAARELTKDYIIPRFYTPLTHLVTGVNGDVWLRVRTATGERDWHVYDASGTRLSTVRLPREANVFAVERRGIWANEVNSDGIESLVLYARPTRN